MKGLYREKVRAILFSLLILCLLMFVTSFSLNSDARAAVLNPGAKLNLDYPPNIQADDTSFIYNDAPNEDSATKNNIVSGTSMACHVAAGIDALSLENNPGWALNKVKNDLESTTTDPVNPGWGYVRGWWLIDAYIHANSSPDEVWVDDDWAGLNPGDPADGHTFGTDAFASIRDGIDAVASGTVHVAAGTYYETLNLKDGIQVLGAGANVTTIDGGANGLSVVNASNVGETTMFDGFTVTHGSAYEGGGITNHNSSLRLSNCIISYNTATTNGGGLYALASPIVVTNCTFIGNTATNTGDVPTNGGGMYGSPLTISNCTFIGNTASDYGGGMCTGGSSTISNCTFTGNTAHDGGGIYNSGSSPTISNCTFTGNAAIEKGGGFYYNGSSAPELTNCTFTGNTANLGGGIYHTSSNTVLTNCILWDNGEEIHDLIAAPVVTYCDVQGGYPGTGNIDADPLFVDAAGGDVHLQSRQGHWTDTGWVLDAQNSPCLDTGDPASPHGNEPAPNGSRINMGAYGNTDQASKSPDTPEVTTNAATSVYGITATLNANLDSLGKYDTINVSFEWGTVSGTYTASTTPEAMTTPGAFAIILNGLSPDTSYYYRTKAAGNTNVYGEEQTFTTCTLPLEVWVDDDWAGLNPGDAADGYTFGYNAFTTIQDGIDGVEGVGGTVYVYDGTYTDNVSVNKNISLQSVNGANVTIVTLSKSDYFLVVSDYVFIRGFTVTGENSAGILLYRADYCTVSDCIISGFGNGIYLDETHNDLLDNNTIQGNTFGIYIDASQDNEFIGNNISNNESGIYLWDSSTGNIIHFNNITGNISYGVFNNNVSENVSARNNWWGDASGPGGAGPGTGDNISVNVDYDPWVGADVGSTVSEAITNSTLDAITEADTTVSVNGTATVTVAEYADNPGSGFSGDIDKHVDVHVNDVTGVNEIEIRLYYTDSDITGKVESSLRMYWYDNSIWVVCSDTGVNTTDINSYSGYIWAKIRNDTNPALDDLSGTPFGAGANQRQSGGSNGGGGGGGQFRR